MPMIYYGTEVNALSLGSKGHSMLEPSLYRQRHAVLDVLCRVRLYSLSYTTAARRGADLMFVITYCEVTDKVYRASDR